MNCRRTEEKAKKCPARSIAFILYFSLKWCIFFTITQKRQKKGVILRKNGIFGKKCATAANYLLLCSQ